MRITANKLTLVRIILIPIPVGLLLFGDHKVKMLGWALYILVGMTDFFDGMLARKYGTTKLGALLDPIADKIYIALMFIPLSLLGYLPHWMVVAILLRDPIITALRSISEMKGVTMKTASLAQYKTAIQMITGGYVMWVFLVPDARSCITGMAGMSGLCLLWFIIYYYFRRRLHPRLITLVGLVTAALPVRYFSDVQGTAFVFGGFVLAVTWLSAANYIVKIGIRLASGPGRVGPSWWILNVLESLALPLVVLIIQGAREIPFWAPMTVLCLEFAVGALDNIMVSDGKSRPLPGTWAKNLVQLALAGLILWKLHAPDSVPASLSHPLSVDAYLLVGATFIAAVLLYARYGIKTMLDKR